MSVINNIEYPPLELVIDELSRPTPQNHPLYKEVKKEYAEAYGLPSCDIN